MSETDRTEYFREYWAANRDRARAANRRWYERNRESEQARALKRLDSLSREKKRAYRTKYPEKYKARYTLHNAIASGKIVRASCEVCGDPKSQAHHHDYSKPLDVQWLCSVCHGQAHRLPDKRRRLI